MFTEFYGRINVRYQYNKTERLKKTIYRFIGRSVVMDAVNFI